MPSRNRPHSIRSASLVYSSITVRNRSLRPSAVWSATEVVAPDVVRVEGPILVHRALARSAPLALLLRHLETFSLADQPDPFSTHSNPLADELLEDLPGTRKRGYSAESRGSALPKPFLQGCLASFASVDRGSSSTRQALRSLTGYSPCRYDAACLLATRLTEFFEFTSFSIRISSVKSATIRFSSAFSRSSYLADLGYPKRPSRRTSIAIDRRSSP